MEEPLTKEEAVALLVAWARKRWLHRGLWAFEVEVSSVESVGTFEVVLESFVETRKAFPRVHPYEAGAPVSGPEAGPPPSVWDVPVRSPADFTEYKVTEALPRTSVVAACDACDEKGSAGCKTCFATGKRDCFKCKGAGTTKHRSGSGYVSSKTCSSCKGRKKVKCEQCVAGRVPCESCRGLLRVERRTDVAIAWSVVTSRSAVESVDAPDALVAKVRGSVVHVEEAARLAPTTAAREGAYRGGAERVNPAVDRHCDALLAELALDEHTRVRRQRLTVNGLLVHRVAYKLGSHEGHFFVYGEGRTVHAPDFPFSIKRVAPVARIAWWITRKRG